METKIQENLEGALKEPEFENDEDAFNYHVKQGNEDKVLEIAEKLGKIEFPELVKKSHCYKSQVLDELMPEQVYWPNCRYCGKKLD